MTTWKIDTSHTAVHFSIRHLMISNVRGEFSGVTGTVELDGKSFENAKLDVTVDAATVNTREAQRDTHLKSADFFDVEKYPTVSFRSTGVKAKSEGNLEIVGDLTIRGITKPVRLEVEGPTAEQQDPWGNTRIGATATTHFDRRDFGLNWNAAIEAGGVVVGHDVKLTLDVELIRT